MAINLSTSSTTSSITVYISSSDGETPLAPNSAGSVSCGGQSKSIGPTYNTSFSVTFTGLSSGTTYTISASCYAGSATTTETTDIPAGVPSISFSIDTSETTSTTIYITNISKTDGVSYYLVYRKTSETGSGAATDVPLGSETVKLISGLSPGTSYTFNAYATDSQGTHYYTYPAGSSPPTETTKNESYISFSARSDSPTSIIVYPITAIGCNPTTYTIFCRETGQTVAQEITISASSLDPNNPPKFSGLTTGTSYVLNVRGTTRSGAQIWAQNTQTIIAGSSTGTYIYYNGRWRLAQPYIYYSGRWRMAQAYIYSSGNWHPA